MFDLDGITITKYVCETHVYPAFPVRIRLLIQFKSFCWCRGWIIYRSRVNREVSHHLIQWLKALQLQLSFPHDWFPSESDYLKIRFAYLRWVGVSEMQSSSTAVVLGNLLGNPLVLKMDLCRMLLEQANNQRLFL